MLLGGSKWAGRASSTCLLVLVLLSPVSLSKSFKGSLSDFLGLCRLGAQSSPLSPMVCRVSASDNGTPSAFFIALVVTRSFRTAPP